MAFCILFIAAALFCLPFQSQGQSQIADTTGAAASLAEGRRLLDAGRYKEAITRFEQAKALYTLVSDAGKLADCLNNIGNCYMDLRNFEKSETAFVQAIAMAEEKLRNQSGSQVADIYVNYGNLLYNKKDIAKSQQYYEKALKDATARCRPDDIVFGSIYTSLALITDKNGNINESKTWLLKALNIYEKAGAGMEKSYAAHLSLGKKYALFGDTDKAFYHFNLIEQWIESAVKLPLRFNVEAFYTYLFRLYTNNQNVPKAIEYSLKNIELTKKKYGAVHLSIAQSYNNLAICYMTEDRVKEADYYLKEALRLADTLCKQPCEVRAL